MGDKIKQVIKELEDEKIGADYRDYGMGYREAMEIAIYKLKELLKS
jgi:hypothetical protein